MFHHLLLAKSFPAGFARVRAHRALGHRTVLITGALDFVVEPLRPLFDEVVCARLGHDADGRLTGRLDQLPPTGEARALVLADYAAREGLDLGEAVAYADSASDLPLLECVGFPVAVNPEARLAAIARRRGWHVEQWEKAGGGARPPLPFGPVDHGVSRWWARLEGMLERATAARPRGRAPRLTGRRGSAMKGLVFERNLARFAASRVASVVGGSGRGAAIGPSAPHRRGATRAARPARGTACHPVLAGICGSDLSTVDGRSSRYFEDVVSFPFVPGPRGGRARSTTPTPAS